MTEPWKFVGDADEERIRRAFAGGTMFTGLPRQTHPSRAMFELSMQVAPCLTCRGPVVVVNGELQPPARIWQADDGRIMVTAHRADCTAIEHQAPEGLLLR